MSVVLVRRRGGSERAGDALLDRVRGGLGEHDQALQLVGGALVGTLPLRLGGAGVLRQGEQLLRPLQVLALLRGEVGRTAPLGLPFGDLEGERDRKSTRLNSSHVAISYAVFCLQKKQP